MMIIILNFNCLYCSWLYNNVIAGAVAKQYVPNLIIGDVNLELYPNEYSHFWIDHRQF